MEDEGNVEPLRSNGVDSEAVLKFVQRIEAVQAAIDDISERAKEEKAPHYEDLKQIRREVRDEGIPYTEFLAIIRKRRLEAKAAAIGEDFDIAEKANYAEMLESLERLAAEVGPLGEAALERARAI